MRIRPRGLPIPRLAVAAALSLVLTGCGDDSEHIVLRNDMCPNWAAHAAGPFENRPSSFLGCANRMNLEMMVERPSDLVKGRPLGSSDGEREAASVKAYREGKVKPFSSGNTPAPAYGSQMQPGGQ